MKPDATTEVLVVPLGLEFLAVKKLDEHLKQNIEEAFIEHIAKALHSGKPLFEETHEFLHISLKDILGQLHQVAPRWRPLTLDIFDAISKHFANLFWKLQNNIDGLKADYDKIANDVDERCKELKEDEDGLFKDTTSPKKAIEEGK